MTDSLRPRQAAHAPALASCRGSLRRRLHDLPDLPPGDTSLRSSSGSQLEQRLGTSLPKTLPPQQHGHQGGRQGPGDGAIGGSGRRQQDDLRRAEPLDEASRKPPARSPRRGVARGSGEGVGPGVPSGARIARMRRRKAEGKEKKSWYDILTCGTIPMTSSDTEEIVVMTQPLDLWRFPGGLPGSIRQNPGADRRGLRHYPGSDLSNRTGAPQARFRSRPRLGRCPTD